jgi:hypothetical protein
MSGRRARSAHPGSAERITPASAARGALRAGCREAVSDDRCVHNGAVAHLHALRVKVASDLLEELLAQTVLLQQVTEPAHRRLIRRGLLRQVHTGKCAHRQRVVQRLFHRRVRQVEPVLEKVHSQDRFQIDRRAAIARLRVHRLDQCTQLCPRHHGIHLRQKLCAARCLAVLLKSGAGQRHLFVLHCRPPFLFVERRSAVLQTSKQGTCSEIP